MAHIIGNHDGPNRRNETYKIGSRPSVPRVKAVREVERGLHKDVHVVTINKRKYIRDNPDLSKRDNVNRN